LLKNGFVLTEKVAEENFFFILSGNICSSVEMQDSIQQKEKRLTSITKKKNVL